MLLCILCSRGRRRNWNNVFFFIFIWLWLEVRSLCLQTCFCSVKFTVCSIRISLCDVLSRHSIFCVTSLQQVLRCFVVFIPRVPANITKIYFWTSRRVRFSFSLSESNSEMEQSRTFNLVKIPILITILFLFRVFSRRRYRLLFAGQEVTSKCPAKRTAPMLTWCKQFYDVFTEFKTYPKEIFPTIIIPWLKTPITAKI